MSPLKPLKTCIIGEFLASSEGLIALVALAQSLLPDSDTRKQKPAKPRSSSAKKMCESTLVGGGFIITSLMMLNAEREKWLGSPHNDLG
ncbi:MAG TPA: hypothetical protein G4N94_11765 [Caldilineae bacterium]|nr:hypothetical protein [Caldilineae bacterium]